MLSKSHRSEKDVDLHATAESNAIESLCSVLQARYDATTADPAMTAPVRLGRATAVERGDEVCRQRRSGTFAAAAKVRNILLVVWDSTGGEKRAKGR